MNKLDEIHKLLPETIYEVSDNQHPSIESVYNLLFELLEQNETQTLIDTTKQAIRIENERK